MKLPRHRHILAVVLVFAAVPLAAGPNPGLFQHKGGPGSSLGDEIFMRLIERPTTIRAAFAEVDVSQFKEDVLRLNPFPELTITAIRQQVGFSGSRYPAWFGTLGDVPGSAVFIFNGDRISGKITSSIGTYEVFPLGDGECIIVEHYPDKFPECRASKRGKASANISADPSVGIPSQDLSAFEVAVPGEIQDGEDDPSSSHIRVIVAYTLSARSRTLQVFGRTMQEHIGLAIAETNQGYANSGVNMRIELACLYKTDFQETYAIEEDLEAFRNDGDGKADEVHVLRADFDADMCCLITDGRDFVWCGDSYGFDYTSRENMFQATAYSCATSNFSFAHEFGHTQGCRHNDDTALTPFAYGHGFRNDDHWRTIMALSNSTSAVRLNYWSNPDIDSPMEPFTPMGTEVNGGQFANDCRTALDEGAETVINHETTPASSSAPTDHAFEEDEFADKLVTDTLSVAGFTASPGSCIQFRAGAGVVLQPGFEARAGCQFQARLTDTEQEDLFVETNPFLPASDAISISDSGTL